MPAPSQKFTPVHGSVSAPGTTIHQARQNRTRPRSQRGTWRAVSRNRRANGIANNAEIASNQTSTPIRHGAATTPKSASPPHSVKLNSAAAPA